MLWVVGWLLLGGLQLGLGMGVATSGHAEKVCGQVRGLAAGLMGLGRGS